MLKTFINSGKPSPKAGCQFGGLGRAVPGSALDEFEDRSAPAQPTEAVIEKVVDWLRA
jgi:hypothetical protein